MVLETWLRQRVGRQCDDPSLQFPMALFSCERTGARPLSPLALLAAVLVGNLLGKTSLRGLEEWAVCDLRALWLLGGFTPDHSTFGRFILRMQGCVSEQLFERLTEEALREVGKFLHDVSTDGTIVQAAASRYKRLCAEAVEQQLTEAQEAARYKPDAPDATKALTHAQACAQTLAERQQQRRDHRQDPSTVTVCPTDLEAVVLKLKEGSFAPAVVASVVATEDRFVVAAQVHATEEIAVVAPMLDQAERLAAHVNSPGERAHGVHGRCAPGGDAPTSGRPCAPESASLTANCCALRVHPEACCRRLLGRAQLGPLGLQIVRADTHYLTGTVLREEQARGLELRIGVGALARAPLGPQGFALNDPRAFDKSRFRLVVLPANDYAPERTCLECPMGALLLLASRESGRPGDPAHEVYRAVGVRCGSCPYHARCAPKNPRRRVARYPDDELKEQMRARLAALPARAEAGRRAKAVEPVFSVVKGVQGLRRFRRRGLRKARVEWHLHLIAHNLRRMMSLAGWRKAA